MESRVGGKAADWIMPRTTEETNATLAYRSWGRSLSSGESYNERDKKQNAKRNFD